ncbi:ATP-binding SpoIIE family protein phosphatase [Salinactinospora qingdaonensis]|uniref:SpoIIE family protein phosphatase n=1 Tax=Salinactinospora qingdaonensis TaxID=702744 RepID=A0ABP7G9K2_9ACTN
MKRSWEAFYGEDALPGTEILDKAQLAMVVLDRLGNLQYWNPAAAELFGRTNDRDLTGTPFPHLGIHEADSELAAQVTHRVLRGENWEGTFAVVRGDASRIHVSARAVPLKSSAGAVEGFLLFAQEAMRNRRIEEQYGLLDRIGSRLSSSLEFDSTTKAVAETLVPQFADHCFIDLYDHDRLIRRVSVHAEGWTPPPATWYGVDEEVHYPEDHFVHMAMLRLDTVFIGDDAHAVDIAAGEHDDPVSEQLGVTSAIAAPLRARGELLGVLTLALSGLSDRDKTSYDGFDRDLVGAIASRVALAIDNAYLFEEERSTALAFQNSLLPHSFPLFDGLSIAHRYVPVMPLEAHGHGIQTQVGGDFYDVIPLSAGRVGIVIGDVEGRGPHAAAVMGQLRAALRAFAQADREPADILRELDEWVRQLGRPDPNGDTWVPSVSCLYMVYDAWSRELSYANAGHQAPLLIHDGRVEELALEISDMLLGLKVKGAPYGESVYQQATMTLPPGATLLLYTDGLVDRRPVGGVVDVRRSLAHLYERVREVANKDVEQIAEAAAAAVPGEIEDDTALLVIRSHPEELSLREGWFVAEAPTVGESRHLAATTFADWGMDRGQAELACLLVSEIVTNVVIHATPHPVRRDFATETDKEADETDALHGIDHNGGFDDFDEDWSDLLEEAQDSTEDDTAREFLLRLRRGANSVWVEVFDRDLRLPRIRSAGADDEGGRGLYLVDQLASRWGSRPTPDGKAVWFEMPMNPE